MKRKLALAIILLGMLLVAWVLQLIIHAVVADGEYITFGHTLGMVVGLTALRLLLDWLFEK